MSFYKFCYQEIFTPILYVWLITCMSFLVYYLVCMLCLVHRVLLCLVLHYFLNFRIFIKYWIVVHTLTCERILEPVFFHVPPVCFIAPFTAFNLLGY